MTQPVFRPFVWTHRAVLAKVLDALPELTEERTECLREELAGVSAEYARARGTLQRYRQREDTKKGLKADISAIEHVLSLPFFSQFQSFNSESDKSCFEWGLKIAENESAQRDHTQAWTHPPHMEITRRALESVKETLEHNLGYVDPFAALNAGLCEEQQVPAPKARDQSPEKHLVGSLLYIFADILGASIQEVPIGNDPERNAFCRFARAVADEIVPHPGMLTDNAIRDHGNRIKTQARQNRNRTSEPR